MDPLVDAFHRINPKDHSLDGLPVTVMVVGVVLLVITTLVLRLTGRSWKVWHWATISVLFAWWAGVNVGHSGFGSGIGIFCTVVLLIVLIEPVRSVIRAALVPANRDGRS